MRALVADDDPRMVKMIRKVLEAERFSVETTLDGETAFRKAKEKKYDVIVLDIMMPERSGFDVVTGLRSMGNDTPIIIVSAKGIVKDRIRAINLGADDYLVKNFSFCELVARIKSLMRRSAQKGSNVFFCGDLVLNLSDMSIRRHQKIINLAKKEFNILLTLLKRKDSVVTRTELTSAVWGKDETKISSNTIDVHMQYLRKKLGNPSLIKTIHGRGFILRTPERETSSA